MKLIKAKEFDEIFFMKNFHKLDRQYAHNNLVNFCSFSL